MTALPVFSEPINVLILDGFSNHDWQRTTQSLQSILEKAGGVKVSVSTFLGIGKEELSAWSPDFESYDVVIQNCNDIKGNERWPRRVEVALEQFVERGGGLYIFHSANNAFPDWLEYNRMIGLGWRKKEYGYAITLDDGGQVARLSPGEGEGTGHGKRVDALLTRLGDHPIHAGFPRQWISADIEIYRYARGPAENMDVLSFARDPKTGLNFPIEWTVAYGKGRVYNSTLGHVWHDQQDPLGMQCAGHQTLIPRIAQWLAKKEIDSALPSDFPTAEARSLRPVPIEKN